MTVTSTSRPVTRDDNRNDNGRDRRDGRARPSWVLTLVLIAGAVYCMIPVAWVAIASTKSPRELFTEFAFLPGGSFFENLQDIVTYGDGQFLLWGANSVLYAGVGALLSTAVSAMAGYGLAKFAFRGRETVFAFILAGVLVPGIVLAIPQYLLLAEVGLAGTYWSVLLPSIISPFGIFLCRVFAQSAVPTEIIEAARVDGAGEWRIFTRMVLPMMVPGLVTVFLLQFVGIWNNFLLPFIMLSDQDKYPMTLGLYSFLAKGAGDTDLYPLIIIGSLVSIIPLMILILVLQRFWRADLLAGGLKG